MPLVRLEGIPVEQMGREGVGISVRAQVANAKTTTGLTDFVDLAGYVSRVAVLIVNGATNAAVVRVKTHFDPLDARTSSVAWSDVDYRTGASASYTAGSTGINVAGGATATVYLAPEARSRFLAFDITTANTNGTSIYVYAER